MFLNRRIGIHRREVKVTVVTSTGRAYYEDFFDVTQSVINNLKVTLTYTPVAESEHVMLNGLEATDESGWDYTISGKDVIFPAHHNLTVGDTLRIKYDYET